MLDLLIQNQQQSVEVPDEQLLQQWAASALLTEKDTQVSLMIVDEVQSQKLNKEYRGKDKPTNILSFPMDMPAELSAEVEMNMLGDLVVCAAVVQREAQQQEKSLSAHWAHMLVHGMLHLQGYDHIDSSDADEMESIEIKMLNQLGFENPYQQVSE